MCAASEMEPNPALPFVVGLDDANDPGDVIDALVLGRFVAGEEPFARTVHLSRVRTEATLLPPGTEPIRRFEGEGRRSVLAVGEGWTLRAARWRGHRADLTVTAVSDELARSVLEAAIDGALEDRAPEDQAVAVGFWHQDRCGDPRRVEKEVAIEPWLAIRQNYSSTASEALSQLMTREPGSLCGRLLLLHGPPGTGKTTALRALAHAWRRWSSMEAVLDPERLLDDPAYLMAVALGEEDEEEERRFRLLLLEDCDELIRLDAKKGTGQALSRLLNLTDGLLGQGMSVLVAITTNEPLHQLHPAIVRPGRCLGEVHVGPLSREEAALWLGCRRGVGVDGATLAELFALRGGNSPVRDERRPRLVGQYL